MKTAKIIKRTAKSALPVSLCAALLLGCVITANAAARKKGDVNVLDEATNTYTVNPDVIPGTLFIGQDGEGNLTIGEEIEI